MTEEVFPAMPIIVGVARSGTTLLRLMLDAHREISIPPETGFIPPIARLKSAGAALREDVFQTITRAPTWEDSTLSAETLWETLAAIEPFSVADGVRAFYRLYATQHGKSRWGDKTPLYCLHLDTIQTLLPEARFLHIIRDGRDVALSVRGLWFTPGHDMESLARDWCARIETARRLSHQCRHYLELRYEDLVRNPRQTLLRICEFLVLPYDPRMEHYFTQARQRLDEVKTRHNPDGSVLITKEERLFIHRFTSHPPEPERLLRWKSAMTNEERQAFVGVARPLLEALGYET
jgi:hypothetical protein